MKIDLLNVLNSTVSQCNQCKDLCYSRTQPVRGCGNITADIVVVGECPGEREDKEGIPFIGRAGKLFNNILVAFEIKRADIYITNTAKCRTPLHRRPTVEEIKNCSAYLDEELKIIEPKFVLCLGTTASQRILNTDKVIGELRGRVHQMDKFKVVVTYHPSYLLRNPEAKKETYKDMALLTEGMKNG